MGCSRAVGQMFKQTSNYLNSIWDLRGVPALESIALLLSPLWLFGSSRVPSVSLLLSFLDPPPKTSSAGHYVKSTRRAFHSLPVLSPGSLLCSADFDLATLSGSLSLLSPSSLFASISIFIYLI